MHWQHRLVSRSHAPIKIRYSVKFCTEKKRNVLAISGKTTFGWRLGVVVSGVRRTSGQVSAWMADRLRAGIPSLYVTGQLGQLSVASLRGRLIEYQLRLG